MSRHRIDHAPGNRSRGKRCPVTGKECRTEREAKKLPRIKEGSCTLTPYLCRYCSSWHRGKDNHTEERMTINHPVLGRAVIKKGS